MNRNLLRIGLFTLAATVCSFSAAAKPAKHGVMTVSTADGTELRVRLAGDEFFHQYYTEDGYPLVERNGNFYYADIDADGNISDSGIKATQIAARQADATAYLSTVDKSVLDQRVALRASKSPRHGVMQQRRKPAMAPTRAADGNDGPPFPMGYGLFSDTHFPSYGDQKAIVILVEYTDVKFKTSYTNGAGDYFTRMLNEDGFADYGGTGCAAEYFRLNSGNNFRPEFDVYGPITLANKQAYYGGNDWWGNDQRPAEMVVEACEILDDTVNFADYDRDGDGVVDNIFIFYAGQGEASGGSANTVWPHSWNMVSAGYPDLYFDGVRVHTYGCSNEWESGRPDGVGTFIHEFSHVMGLPDLYATSYTSAFTPGSWSALDYGPYNNDGMTPPLYGAFERYALGWVKPFEVDRAVNATLQPISENVCGVIRTNKDTEFFLLENRQKESWDTYIPGHGMLIWHVDYNDGVWTSNTVNNSANHQYVDIEEADNSRSESTRAGDAFPGTGNKTSFTASTSPAMKTWNNQAIDYPITDIAENGGVITFKVLGGAVSELPVPEVNAPDNVSAYGFRISWTPVEGFDAILNVYTRPESGEAAPLRLTGTEQYLPGYRNRNMGSASEAILENLEPETIYYYTIAMSSGWETSEPSEEIMAFTGKLTLEYYAVNALEADEVTDNSFKANWQPLEDATDYLVTVYSIVPGNPYEDVCDFTGGVENLHGWTTPSRLTYAMTAFCGEAVPSLRLTNGSTLTSPTYAGGVSSLSFWHRGNNTTTGDLINVYAISPAGQTLVKEVEIRKAEGGVTTVVDDLPANTSQIVLEFKRLGDSGSLAIDDVKVYHGKTFDSVPMEDFADLSSNGENSLTVSGLNALSNYGYTVRATNGELFSKPSKLIFVDTTAPSAVSAIADGKSLVRVIGNLVMAVAGDEIVAYDCTGAVVARGVGMLTLPANGLYIVTVPSRNFAAKHIVK